MEPRLITKIYLLPIIMGIELAAGIITCFLIALVRGDVSAYVPFISETGAKPPESGILGLFLVIGAFLGITVMSIRFLIVSELNSGHLKKIDIINALSLIIGYLSLGGMIVVAVYPMSTIMTAHMVGATSLFLGGAMYGFLQCLLTYWLYPTHNGIVIFWIRMAICIACFSFLVLMVIILPIGIRLWQASHSYADKTPKDKDNVFMQSGIKQWQSSHPTTNKIPGDKGFAEILTSALCEWFMAFSFLTFFLTYIREFRKVVFKLSTHPLVNHFDEDIGDLQMQMEGMRAVPYVQHT